MKVNKIKKLINIFIPDYAILPLLAVITCNMLTYFGTRPFTENLYHHYMGIGLDERITLVTAYVYPYIFAYVQWILGFIIIARVSREFCRRYLYAEICAKLLCMTCFILYPTTIVRPEITGTGLADILTSYIYAADPANNLFPSIHCLESYVVLRSAFALWKKKSSVKRTAYLVISVVFTALVFASTVYLKQHVVLDIVGAVAVVEIGMLFTWALGRIAAFSGEEKRAPAGDAKQKENIYE